MLRSAISFCPMRNKKRPARGGALEDLPAAVRSTAGQHVSLDTARRINRFRNRMIVVARNDDRVAVRIDTADDADMAATAASHHGASADLWSADTGSVTGIGAREIAAACVP